MVRARFEKIGEIQNDAIKLGPARRGIYRCAIHFANDEIVVCDLMGSGKRIGAICVVRSMEGWHTHMLHRDEGERPWTG
jgi:hypothetical protein